MQYIQPKWDCFTYFIVDPLSNGQMLKLSGQLPSMTILIERCRHKLDKLIHLTACQLLAYERQIWNTVQMEGGNYQLLCCARWFPLKQQREHKTSYLTTWSHHVAPRIASNSYMPQRKWKYGHGGFKMSDIVDFREGWVSLQQKLLVPQGDCQPLAFEMRSILKLQDKIAHGSMLSSEIKTIYDYSRPWENIFSLHASLAPPSSINN